MTATYGCRDSECPCHDAGETHGHCTEHGEFFGDAIGCPGCFATEQNFLAEQELIEESKEKGA